MSVGWIVFFRFASEHDNWEVPFVHSNYTEAYLYFTFCKYIQGTGFCKDKSAYACIIADNEYVVQNAGSRVSG